MSCPVWDFPKPEESQAIFDRLVASTETSSSASPADKLAALRDLSEDQMEKLLNGSMATPAWDSKWFVNHDEDSSFENIKQFPEWIDGLTIGYTKDECALFGQDWLAWPVEHVRQAVASVVHDVDMAREILEVYNISDSQNAVRGLFDFATDSLFAPFPVTLGAHELPISVYRFDQPDTFGLSPLNGYAYHALDCVFFSRLPAVAGPNAEKSMQATANAMSGAVSDLVYGEQPWEPFEKAGKVMLFNGEESGLVTFPSKKRWSQFVSTKERAELFRAAGRTLLSYQGPKRKE
jgi:hypothetical protein